MRMATHRSDSHRQWQWTIGVGVAVWGAVVGVGCESPPAAQPPENSRAASDRNVDSPDRLAKQCEEFAQSLRTQLPPGCRVLVRVPFVIAGDVTEERLSAVHQDMIRPLAKALHDSYSLSLPTQPMTVILGSNEARYRSTADWLYADHPATRFGYYKPGTRTVLVNLETGSSALAHELTHALLAFDLSSAPAWLDEGLAALHESYFEDCRPVNEVTLDAREDAPTEPLDRWPVLRRALERDQLPSLAELVHAPRLTGDREAVYYAQARYFCLYLRECGVLADLIARFRAAGGSDVGEQHLSAVFSGRPLVEIDVEFRRWINVRGQSKNR